MSAATEIAEREAAEAEAENPDAETPEPIEGEPAPTEPEPEPEPEPSSQTVVEQADKRLIAEAKRHENALAKLHPEDWDQYAMCPLCIGDGFLTPIAPGEMPDQIWEAVTVLAGREKSGELPIAPYAEVCPTCEGFGQVRTGARNDTNFSVICRDCAGYGWLDTGPAVAGVPQGANIKRQPVPAPQLAAVPAYAPQASTPWPDYDLAFVPFPGGQPDDFNRPAGHPRWGLDTTVDGRKLR